jgi:hypothetical protein
MRFEDLSAADQKLVNTDFGSLEKVANDQVAQAQEMYEIGFSKLASQIADQLDAEAEAAAVKVAEDLALDPESEKLAASLGAFIERGQYDGLRKLGSDRHGNEWHYLLPFVEEKVAAAGGMAALKNFGSKLQSYAAQAGAKAKGYAGQAGAKAKEVGAKAKDYHKGMADDARGAATGRNAFMDNVGVKGKMTAGQRASSAGNAALKASPYALAAGAGLAAAKMKSNKED